MDEIPSDRELRRSRSHYRWLAESHDRAMRFHLAFNLAFAAAALWLLKIEGPDFADAISAGLFVCGFFACVMSIRVLSAGESAMRAAAPPDEPARPRSATLVLVCLAIFHLGSAIATVWLTYFGTGELQPYPDATALLFLGYVHMPQSHV